METDLAGRRSLAKARGRAQARVTGRKSTVSYRGSGGKTETVTIAPPKDAAPPPSPGIVSGGMSTAEKLVSQNPAVRAEGQRELASLSTGAEQTGVFAKATQITQKDYAGVISPTEIEAKVISPLRTGEALGPLPGRTYATYTWDQPFQTYAAPKNGLTQERALQAGLTVEAGQIRLETAGDWLRYSREMKWDMPTFQKELRTYHPETAGDWLRLKRKKDWSLKEYRRELRKAIEPQKLKTEQLQILKTKGYAGVVEPFTPLTKKEVTRKVQLEKGLKVEARIQQVLGLPGVKKVIKGVEAGRQLVALPITSFYEGVKVTTGITPEKIGKGIEKGLKKIPPTSIEWLTTPKVKYEKKRAARAEFIGGAVTGVIAYPREKPVTALLLPALPGVFKKAVTVTKIAPAYATLSLAKAGLLKPAGVATLATLGKVTQTVVGAGIVGTYAVKKVRAIELAPTPRAKGIVFGKTAFEVAAVTYGAKAYRPGRLEEYYEARFATPLQVAVTKYGTPENIRFAEETGKLGLRLSRSDVIVQPRGEVPFRKVKGVTTKTGRQLQKYFELERLAMVKGSASQSAFLEKTLQKQFIKIRGGRISDIDIALYGKAKGPLGIKKFEYGKIKQKKGIAFDVKRWEQAVREIGYRPPQLTQKEVQVQAFQYQSYRKAVGAFQYRYREDVGPEFGRLGKDIRDLLFQAKQAKLAGYKVDTSYIERAIGGKEGVTLPLQKFLPTTPYVPITPTAKPFIAEIPTYRITTTRPSKLPFSEIYGRVISRPSKPSMPSYPSVISIAPSYPSRPSYPSVSKVSYPSRPSYAPPSLPSLPRYPSRPSYPSMPSYPSYPSLPSYPSPSYPSYPSYPSVSKITETTTTPFPDLDFGPRRKKKVKRKRVKPRRVTKYKPSLVAAEKMIYGKKPKILTGLEVRPLLNGGRTWRY